MNTPSSIVDRWTLITGAAGDIGLATAKAFLAAGEKVVLTDRRQDALEQTVASLKSEGGQVEGFASDQTDDASVEALFEKIKSIGGLKSVFINAGYGQYGALIDITPAQWRRHVDINLTGGFMIAQKSAQLMRDSGQGGAIVFNASTAASHVCDMLGAYASSKAGVAMLSRSLASELGPHRIRVNTILPGVIETKMTESLLQDGDTKNVALSETPVGRLGKPEDIAELVVFLCSEKSGYITGADILVDGGQTIHGFPRWFAADYRDQDAKWEKFTKDV